MKDIYITGGAMTPFARHAGVSRRSWRSRPSCRRSTMPTSARTTSRRSTTPTSWRHGPGPGADARPRHHGTRVYNVENACASGATAVHLACHALRLGQYDTVLVLGVEQLTPLGGGTIPLQRNDHKTELYARPGMVLPAVYAMRGTRYLHERNETPADLAASRSRTAPTASRNPFAQQRREVTVEEVLASRLSPSR